MCKISWTFHPEKGEFIINQLYISINNNKKMFWINFIIIWLKIIIFQKEIHIYFGIKLLFKCIESMFGETAENKHILLGFGYILYGLFLQHIYRVYIINNSRQLLSISYIWNLKLTQNKFGNYILGLLGMIFNISNLSKSINFDVYVTGDSSVTSSLECRILTSHKVI